MQRPSPKQIALLSYLGLATNVSKEQAGESLSQAFSAPELQDRLFGWNSDKLKLHPDLYAKEVAEHKAGRAVALWSASNNEYGALGHPLKRVTKGQAADAIRYLDEYYPGWDADLWGPYGMTNVDALYDYFVPAIEATHPEAVKKTYAGMSTFGPKQSVNVRPLPASPIPRSKRSPSKSSKQQAGALAMLIVLTPIALVFWWVVTREPPSIPSAPRISHNSTKQVAQTSVRLEPSVSTSGADPTATITPTKATNSDEAKVLQPLSGQRTWTDLQGRKLDAALISVSRDEQGKFLGNFQRPTGEKFEFLLGGLSMSDVAFLKQLLAEKGIYETSK